jgi:hypothetical protein
LENLKHALKPLRTQHRERRTFQDYGPHELLEGMKRIRDGVLTFLKTVFDALAKKPSLKTPLSLRSGVFTVALPVTASCLCRCNFHLS